MPRKRPRSLAPALHAAPYVDTSSERSPIKRFRADQLASQITKQSEKSYHCSLCPRRYKNSQSLGRHVRDSHGGQDGRPASKRLKCPHCDQTFQRPDGVRTHTLRKHPEVLLSDDAEPIATRSTSIVPVQTLPAEQDGSPVVAQQPSDTDSEELSPPAVIQDPAIVQRDRDTTFHDSSMSQHQDRPLFPALHSRVGEDASIVQSPLMDVDHESRHQPLMPDLFDSTLPPTLNSPVTTFHYDRTHAQDDLSMSDSLWRFRDDYLKTAQGVAKEIENFGTNYLYPAIPDTGSTVQFMSSELARHGSRHTEYMSDSETRRERWCMGSSCCWNGSSYCWKDSSSRTRTSSLDFARRRRRAERMTSRSRSRSRCHILMDCYQKNRCGPRRYTPPILGVPEPLDLQRAIEEKSRRERFIQLMESFRKTHSKFELEDRRLLDMGAYTPVGTRIEKTLRIHKLSCRQAWRDGMDAVRKILAGDMPTDLRKIIGVVQVASAMRKPLGDVDTSVATDDSFLDDLGRWMALLDPVDRDAFEYYSFILWGKRPVLNTEWKDPLDPDTVKYYQDLLAGLLLDQVFAPVDPDHEDAHQMLAPLGDLENAFAPSVQKDTPGSDFTVPSTQSGNSAETPESSEEEANPQSPSRITRMLPLEWVEVMAGAIFALIMAYLLMFHRMASIDKIRGSLEPEQYNTWQVFKQGYFVALALHSIGETLPQVHDFVLRLLKDAQAPSIASFEHDLMHEMESHAPNRLYGGSVSSCVREAMYQCSKQSRRWLRHSALVTNCRFLELLLDAERRQLASFSDLVQW